MIICRLPKKIGGNFILFNFNDYIYEIIFFSWVFIGKSKVGVKFVKSFQNLIKIFLCICPNEKILSMNLSQYQGFISWDFKNSVSI